MTDAQHNQTNQRNEELESQFDLQFWLNLMWYLRYWMIASALICLCVAFLYLKTKNNTYASQMMVLITTDKNAGMNNSAQMSFIQDMTGFASFNSIDNEKVIIRSTPVIQKVVEEQTLNVRYFNHHTFRDEETLGEEIRLEYLPDSRFNVNNLPLIRTEYEVIDSTSMRITLTDQSLNQMGYGDLIADSVVHLPFSIQLPRYGELRYTYVAPAEPLYYPMQLLAEPQSKGERYILLYSPQARAQEICNSISVAVVEEGRHSASFGSGSSILNLTMVDIIPSRAEAVLEGVVNQYNQQTKQYYTMSYTNTMEFIQKRLVDLREQLSGVEGRMRDFSVGNNVYDIQSQTTFSLNNDMHRQQQSQEIDIQINLLSMVSEELKKQQGYTTIPSNLGITDNTIVSSIADYNRLCVERLRLLNGSSESSPVVKQLDLQLNTRRDLISKTIENQISILTSQKNEIIGQLHASKSKMKQLPGQRLDLAGIEREQSIIEPLYVLLQKKSEETMLAIIAEPDVARIVEHSENNSALIGPNRRRTYAIAFLLGLLIPLAFVYVRMLLKSKIATPEDITSRTHLPIVAVIPQGPSRPVNAQQIIADSSKSTTTEVFRSLRASLTFMEGKVFQVTSSVPSEGKSFVSTNLAICFAAAGKKTILVETDLRKGHQRRVFEATREQSSGLSEYLSQQEEDWHKLLLKIPNLDTLHVLLKGAIPPNPNELLSSSRLEQLITELKAEYDYIILDSPPYLLIADPISINRVADRNVYVMRAGVSDLRFVNEIDMAARNERLTKPVIVLNGLNMEAQSYYGHGRYGYGYGYAYGYSYGYEESHDHGHKLLHRLRHKWK